MREVILDTETTGLDPKDHRIIEIGCVELIGHVPTGKTYHQYINPQREVPKEAFDIHGLSGEFLKDFPVFSDIAEEFIQFIGEAKLVIHNAAFDMAFINAELERIGKDKIPQDSVLDTLLLARTQFPGASNSLDALCRRFSIDNSHREKHGALLDSELLAEVYIELIGGKQAALTFSTFGDNDAVEECAINRVLRPAREFILSDDERFLHEDMLKKIKKPLWVNN